jgi:hypothetical protein
LLLKLADQQVCGDADYSAIGVHRPQQSIGYSHLQDIQVFFNTKGIPVHVAPACTGSGEGSDHFRSYVHSLSLHFCKRLFPGPHGHKATTLTQYYTIIFGIPVHQVLKILKIYNHSCSPALSYYFLVTLFFYHSHAFI